MHGQLSVEGLKIVGKNRDPSQLKGMSMFWSQWSGQYWNADVVNWLAQNVQLNFIRAAARVVVFVSLLESIHSRLELILELEQYVLTEAFA